MIHSWVHSQKGKKIKELGIGCRLYFLHWVASLQARILKFEGSLQKEVMLQWRRFRFFVDTFQRCHLLSCVQHTKTFHLALLEWVKGSKNNVSLPGVTPSYFTRNQLISCAVHKSKSGNNLAENFRKEKGQELRQSHSLRLSILHGYRSKKTQTPLPPFSRHFRWSSLTGAALRW